MLLLVLLLAQVLLLVLVLVLLRVQAQVLRQEPPLLHLSGSFSSSGARP
ncbi:MAG: hypothetical protein VCD34_07980 [Planctomycetota bacterium]